jgi:uncharacterized protein (DUF433 family)
MATTASWISKKPGRCGGDACVRETRIPVWGLVERRQNGQADADILRSFPDLTPDDLTAAWTYAAAHPDEIERSIWQNEACMVAHDGRDVPPALVRRGRALGLSDEDIRNAFVPPLTQEALEAALAAIPEG